VKTRRATLPSPVMTVKEVAAFLRINPHTVYKLVRSDEIPSFKVGGDYRFNREGIEKWLAEKQQAHEGSKSNRRN
jgi:excisionase family DNA binding protein